MSAIELGTAAALGAAGLATLAYGAYEPNSRLFGPVIGSGPRERSVYLTFDDGPNERATPVILECLTRLDVTAAFFMVGTFVRRSPSLAAAAAAAGHLVGNHTDTHVKLHRHGPGRIGRELAAAHEAVLEYARVTPRAFRAPHGYRNPFVRRATARFGYDVFGWTFGVWDSARPGAEEIRRRVRTQLRPGAILLLHDGDGYDPTGDRMQTAAALPGIIADIRNAGYRIRPLAELLTK